MDGHGLAEDLFVRLSARIAEVSGIRLPASKRWLLAARVAERQRETGHRDARSYVRALVDERDLAELGRLIEAVRVGESHFFRHVGQLRAIRRVALPQIVARREREGALGVRAWSAGCASGEEAYTLAMLLEDALPRDSGWSHEVLATDLSEAALAQARVGRYPSTSVREVPPEIARWALTADGDDVRVTERARVGVRFERRNLLDATYPRGFDLVLCRNVLIYFDRTTQDDVVRRLVQSVVPGGYLALGYTEHVREAEAGDLLPLRADDGVLYLRAEPSAPPAPALLAEARATVKRGTERPVGAKPASLSPPTSVRPTTTARPPAPFVSTPPAPTSAVLEGELAGTAGCATTHAALAGLMSSTGDAVLDLRGLRFADDAVARLLARAAAALASDGRALLVRTSTPGTERFLRRHGIVPPAVLARDEGEVA
jgi:chemotaxis protein methyltransferase CheR